MSEVLAAAELLGIAEPGALSGGELRRAYLRAVKAHPPERDPDGFQRVRAAYELLQQAVQLQKLREAVASSNAQAPASETAPPTDATEAQAPASETAPPTGSTGAGTSVTDRTDLRPLCPPEDPVHARIANLRQAVVAEDLSLAGRLLAELYAEPALPIELAPPPDFAARTALMLFANGDELPGRRLVAAFEGYAKRVGAGTEFGPQMAALWVLLGELSKLTRHVEDPRVAPALAKALLEGAVSGAAGTIESVCRRNPEILRDLVGFAPTLAASLAPYLRLPKPVAKRSRFNLHLGWMFFVVLSGIGHLVTDREPSPRSHASTQSDSSLQAQSTGADTNAQRTTTLEFTLKDAIDRYDCDSVRDLWAAYRSAFETARSFRQLEEVSKLHHRARVACPELDLPAVTR